MSNLQSIAEFEPLNVSNYIGSRSSDNSFIAKNLDNYCSTDICGENVYTLTSPFETDYYQDYLGDIPTTSPIDIIKSKPIKIQQTHEQVYRTEFVDYDKDNKILYIVEWYDNGNPKYLQTNFALDEISLLFTDTWYPNGVKQSEWVSDRDFNIIKYYGWYQNGAKQFEINYKLDKVLIIDGTAYFWESDGSPEAEIVFKQRGNQVVQEHVVTWPWGQPIKETQYLNNSIKNIMSYNF